jgi:hypothetical protein
LRSEVYIYPGCSPPAGSHLIHPPHLLSPQRLHESSAISDEPPQEFFAAGDFSRYKLASSSSSSLEIMEVISTTPLAAMDPESPHQAATSEAAESSA